MSAQNKVLIRRYAEEIWNKGNLAVADEMIARKREKGCGLSCSLAPVLIEE